MRVVSWNVNGIRACVKKGFAGFLERAQADVVGVQEVRALYEEIPTRRVRRPAGTRRSLRPSAGATAASASIRG